MTISSQTTLMQDDRSDAKDVLVRKLERKKPFDTVRREINEGLF
jgi:hypothetical protein